MVERPRWVRMVPLVAAVAALLFASVAPVAAGALPAPPKPTHHGKVGPHSLGGSQADPAATCYYGSAPDDIRHFTLRAPVVKAAAGHSHQTVGWRIGIEYWNGSAFKRQPATSYRKAAATPTQAATFASRAAKADTTPLRNGYRARVDFAWYASDGATITGSASIWPTWYQFSDPSGPLFVQANFCGDTLG